MTLNQILQLYCIIHLVLCALIYAALRLRWLHFSKQMMPMILLVPVTGVLTAIAAEIILRTGANGSWDITLEDPHLEYADLRLHRIDRDDHGQVVPIQEALRVNNAETRRALILEIIRRDPKNYIQQLREACSDGDLDVSHYASTAIMEIQREYELGTQKAEADHAKDPEDPNKLHHAINCMQRYIDSGLIDLSVAPAYRHRLAMLLDKQIAAAPEDMDARLTAVDNYLALEDLTDAKALSDAAVQRWPNREQVWLTRLKVCYAMRDAEGIRNTLAEIRQRNVYLSPEGRLTLQFWQNTQKQGA